MFPSYDHFSQVVGDYCVSVRMDPKWKTTNNKRGKSEDYVSYRVTCPRSGKHKSKKKPGQSNSRPTRDSLKVDCGFCINAARERMPTDARRNAESVRISSVSLEHTNGCQGGEDQEMVFALRKRAGRSYPQYALDHLRKEVQARRYGTDDVKSWLIQSGFLDATLEEATNLSFVYQYLVTNTTCKKNWEDYLAEACRKRPGASEYLQQLSLSKVRWGNPWRIENFTLDMEASSVVEGSFSAFQRHLAGQVHSFTGVVQQHIQKDQDKISEERKRRVKASVAVFDESIQGLRTKAAQECAMKCSVKVVENFIKTNLEAQEYSFEEMAVLSDEQLARGVTKAYVVYLKCQDRNTQPLRVRVVEFKDGVYYCMWCKKDINSGQPCKHIQRVCDFEFNESQFHDHWKLFDTEVKSIPAVSCADSTSQATGIASLDDTVDIANDDFHSDEPEGKVGTADLHTAATDNVQVGGDGTGEFVPEFVANPLMQAKPYRAQKAKPLSSVAMHNTILDKSKRLASIASGNTETYKKLLPVLDYMIANIQNLGEKELKGAAASYLDLKQATTIDHSHILPSIKKRNEGGTSMKRKKSGVETVVTAKRFSAQTCDLCKGIGHNKASCVTSKQFGKRLTKATWGLIETVAMLDEIIETANVDPCVAKEAVGVHIIGKVVVCGIVIYKAGVILKGLAKKDCKPLYLEHDTVSRWALEGQSGSHYVFLHGK